MKPQGESRDQFRVVCLAGSAGGLPAYIEILSLMPTDSGMAFVVAPHRAIDNAELLPQLLAKVTRMPVADVGQGMRIAPNRVFIMPPHTDMTVVDGTFNLRNAVRPRGWPKTINIFLSSLAEAFGARAIAVILSGLDGDGSAALKTVKDAGGVTFAQSDASFESMPLSAVETGHIDHLLPAADIAKALIDLAHEPLNLKSETTFPSNVKRAGKRGEPAAS
jgi:chemotaxis response regulator CheB